jgi:choice-of-anchor B domain-containing protein
MEATTEWDEGRTAMTMVMKAKEKSWAATDRCIADGSCPELRRLPLNGAYKCVDGIAGDIPCKNVHQLSFLTFAQMGYVDPIVGDPIRGNDVWGWEDPLNGDEYVIMGFSGGTSFVRITDPVNPVPVGFMYSATTHSSWRDIKVIGNYAYIVSEARDHGLQVFDLRHLRGRMTVAYFTPDAVLKTFGNAHNIVSHIEKNLVYVVGATASAGYQTCRGGLLIVDVSDPLNPRQIACFGDDGYVHDAQCVVYHGPDTRYQGRELCFCFNENSLTFVDVEDKNNMRIVAKTAYINVAYTHQGWLTENHEVLLADDEQDEINKPLDQQFTKTYTWDIRNIEMPQLRSIFESSERSIDHNQYIIGDYTYQANYESGLRILHINQAAYTLSNVGYFDAYPSRTTAQFNGLWSVFPFYKSGVIALSSINHGLFIVEPDWDGINALVKSNTTYAEQTRSRPILESELNARCPAQVESKPCEAAINC